MTSHITPIISIFITNVAQEEKPKETLTYEEAVERVTGYLEGVRESIDTFAAAVSDEGERTRYAQTFEIKFTDLELNDKGEYRFVEWGTSGVDGSSGHRLVVADGRTTRNMFPDRMELHEINPWAAGQARQGNLTEYNVVTVENPTVVLLVRSRNYADGQAGESKETIEIMTTPEHREELETLTRGFDIPQT